MKKMNAVGSLLAVGCVLALLALAMIGQSESLTAERLREYREYVADNCPEYGPEPCPCPWPLPPDCDS